MMVLHTEKHTSTRIFSNMCTQIFAETKTKMETSSSGIFRDCTKVRMTESNTGVLMCHTQYCIVDVPEMQI